MCRRTKENENIMNKKNTPNNKNFNLTINKKSKTNNSQNKKKEQITINPRKN